MSRKIKIQKVSHPEGIESLSLGIIDSEVPEPRPYQGRQWAIVRRMIHTTADFGLLDLVRFHPRSVEAGLIALGKGCTIVADTEMARVGMPVRRLEPLGCKALCLMNDQRVVERAASEGITRAYAAVDVAVNEIRPEIYVIGNAPTALIRLVEHMEAGRAKPELVVGMPVGFVNAVESKELLLAQEKVPFITIRGRKGGSALAACVINALSVLFLEEKSARG